MYCEKKNKPGAKLEWSQFIMFVEEFARDFFLTYPAFMPVLDLCTFMLQTYHDKSPPATSHMCTSARNSRLSTTEELVSAEATDEQMFAKKQR